MAVGASFDTTLHQMVHAIVTVLAVINPVVCGSIFLNLTPNLGRQQKRQAAVRTALTILMIHVSGTTRRPSSHDSWDSSSRPWACNSY
jgi:hypothetical protein